MELMTIISADDKPRLWLHLLTAEHSHNLHLQVSAQVPPNKELTLTATTQPGL